MIFRFSALYPYLLEAIEFCFYLSPNFRLLPSKSDAVKKIETLQKNGGQFRASSVKEQEVLCEIQRLVV